MKERKQLALSPLNGGAAFSLTVAVYLILSLIAAAIIKLAGIEGTDGAKYINYLVSPIAIGITLSVAVFYARQPIKTLLPIKARPKYYLIAVLLIFGLLFSLNQLNDYLIKLFELMGYERKNNTIPDVSGWKIVPAFIVIAVIPAIMEEILFRGIVLNNSEEGVGSLRVIFLAGMCFSLYHGSVEQTLYQFVCGCLFAFLAVRSRAVTPVVLIHFLNNALILILYACNVIDQSTGGIVMPMAAEITVYVLSGLSLIGSTVWLILDKAPLKPCNKGSVKQFFLGASAGIAAMAIVWIAGLFI